VFERFAEQTHRILDLAQQEAERCGHRHLGPEHVLPGVLAEGHSRAAQLLWAHGVELEAARAALGRLVRRGVVPAPRPSDADLLGTLGIDLAAVRAHHRAGVRRPGGGGGDPAGDPPARLGGPKGGVDTPVRTAVPVQACPAAHRRVGARVRHVQPGPEHVLLGLLEDAYSPVDSTQGSRRHRRFIAHVGLPEGYRGAAGPLLAALGVRLEGLREAVAAQLGGVRP
jgi:hypothetical protein